MKVQFIGDGGHAGNLKYGLEIVEQSDNKVLAFGGMDCEKLEQRVIERPDGIYPNIVNSKAYTELWDWKRTKGVQVLANAAIMNNVTLGDFCIINTGAIIEHDSVIGTGVHVAPGAIVLGNCKIGEYSFIAAGAIVIQGCTVPPRTFVKAHSIWNKK
jgi:UDP-3-O-[3-hydroxymyristoyl] glucosamine N-acyltransferase